MRWQIIGAATMALALAACGTNSQDRTQGGAAAGALTGAGVGALGGPVGALAGAAIGGGVGAVTGATTSASDINLGRPVWNNPEVRTPADNRRPARRARTTTAHRTPDADRAYMGGGMVGTDRPSGAGTTTATPAPAAPMTGAPMTGAPMTAAPGADPATAPR